MATDQRAPDTDSKTHLQSAAEADPADIPTRKRLAAARSVEHLSVVPGGLAVLALAAQAPWSAGAAIVLLTLAWGSALAVAVQRRDGDGS